ncbi:MAG: hypothetical protein AAF840_08685, partial [Bacteroidota bacterium]
DFDGDGVSDSLRQLIYQGSLGFLVQLSSLETPDTIGVGVQQIGPFNDYFWADTWAVQTPGPTEEVTFAADGDVLGGRSITLPYASTKVSRAEEGGGLLACTKAKSWHWIHQSD